MGERRRPVFGEGEGEGAERRAGGQDQPAGIALAVAAYALWGLFPLYFKAVAAVPALEVLAHRVVWALAVVSLALLASPPARRAVAAAVRRPRLLATLFCSAALLSVNWGVFIYAVATDRVLDASLGYFINPLVSVLLGVVFLRERLGRGQWLAVALAAVALAVDIAGAGRLPWIALVLAVTFAGYGLIRKIAPIEALAGLFTETMLIAPLALAYLLVLAAAGAGAFAAGSLKLDFLLVLSGPITALPLVLFVAGGRRMRLTTLGLLQYLVPSCHFLLAIFAFGEPISLRQGISFALIWLALGLYGAETVQRAGRLAVRGQR